MEAALLAEFLNQPLISRDDLANRLHVSPDTVQLWTGRKKIPAFRLGHRTVRYSYPAVVAALGKFYQPQKGGWSRKLPKRRPRCRVDIKWIQPELPLEFLQMNLFVAESKAYSADG